MSGTTLAGMDRPANAKVFPGRDTRMPARLSLIAWGLSLLLHVAVLLMYGAWFGHGSRQSLRYPVRLEVTRPAFQRLAVAPPAATAKGPTADEAAARWRELLRKRPFGMPGTPEWGAGTDTAGGEGRAGAIGPAVGPAGPGFPEGRAGAFAPEEEPGGLAPLLARPVAEMDVPVAMDMLELDAERRERTVVLIDPQTRRLRKAYLHLPVYGSDDPRSFRGGQDVAEIFRLLNSRMMRYRTPVECQAHYYRMGTPVMGAAMFAGGRPPDPIHSFANYPNRHLLQPAELAQYPFVFLSYIDVQSTRAMVDYLVKGGFAVVSERQLGLLFLALQQRRGAQVNRLSVGLEHPLFHCEFDIGQYAGPNLCCPPLGPLPGLELNGRLVAVCCPPFVWRPCYVGPGGPYSPPIKIQPECPSNLLYVNVLVWGLIQPSRMGGRYWTPQ